MKKTYVVLLVIICILMMSMTGLQAQRIREYDTVAKQVPRAVTEPVRGEYVVQWQMNFGDDRGYGARYEGPQPIGDCDNDGDNEMLVVGRDNKIRVFEWDEDKQTYLEVNTLFPPFYPFQTPDAGGFAIGDLTGDKKNEIAATWGTSVHKYINGKYRTIGLNSYVFNLGGGSADCLIGDFDTDGTNELIVTGGPMTGGGTAPEVVIFKWTPLGLVKVAEWNNPSSSYTYVYFPGIGDIDEDGKNELVVGSGFKVYVLDWNEETEEFEETVIKTTGEDYYPFGCVLKDSDNDGKLEIHLSYWNPMISIFEWDGDGYELKFEIEWPGEGTLIEGIDVGDVDDDGMPEVCAGTHLVHILQWNGTTYIEEAVLPTFGHLAVVSIGDCDNDGKNEIQAGSVMIDHHEDFMCWVYKYEENPIERASVNGANGALRVHTESNILNLPIKNASVAAWDEATNIWYDIQPERGSADYYARNDLPEGEYLLRAHMEEYVDQETTITIVAGEETTYTFSLKRANAHGVSATFSSTSLIFNPLVKQGILHNMIFQQRR